MAEIKYVDWDGLVYYDSRSKQYIDDKFEGCLKMGGIIPFSNLPSPSFQNLNYVYKITEEFTSNEFFEKQGYTYKAGTWVQVIDIDSVYLYTIFNEEFDTPILPGGELDLSNYYTISQTDDAISSAVASIESKIPTVDDFIAAIPDEYVTDTELSAMNYATESFVEESIGSTTSNYYTKAEVDDVIDELISSIEIPEVDVDSFATKDELRAKSDAVLFTTDLLVNNPVGKFEIGDSVKGLTIKQILTKILALSSTVDPDTTDSLIETIIKNEIPMYQLDANGNMIEGSEYTYKEMTPEQASLAPTDECFYQIKDSFGRVIESGYQHLSTPTDDMFYLVLLPSGVTFGAGGNTTHQVWDEGQQIWTTSNLELTSDTDTIKAVLDENDLPFPVYNESDYTLWADSSFESWAGADYRFIINEDK